MTHILTSWAHKFFSSQFCFYRFLYGPISSLVLKKIAEVFGYKASRSYALSRLARSGGWSNHSDQPTISAEEEGVRRPVSDMILMVFHLVISSLVPVVGVDVKFAERSVSLFCFFLPFLLLFVTALCRLRPHFTLLLKNLS